MFDKLFNEHTSLYFWESWSYEVRHNFNWKIHYSDLLINLHPQNVGEYLTLTNDLVYDDDENSYESIAEINIKLNENHNKLKAMILMLIIPKECAFISMIMFLKFIS